MPPKAEYWTLTNEQFREIKVQINELGEKILESLQQNGFTKIKSSNDWLGVTVEKKQGKLLIFIAFSLYRETPLEFELVLRRWNINNPNETFQEFYRKEFGDINEFESAFDDEIKVIKEKLVHSI